MHGQQNIKIRFVTEMNRFLLRYLLKFQILFSTTSVLKKLKNRTTPDYKQVLGTARQAATQVAVCPRVKYQGS